MEFKLEQEQILEILENYGGTEELIEDIENLIIAFDVVNDADDYYEIVVGSVSRVEAEKLEAERKKEEPNYNLRKIVKYETIRKFQEKGIDKVEIKEAEPCFTK